MPPESVLILREEGVWFDIVKQNLRCNHSIFNGKL